MLLGIIRAFVHIILPTRRPLFRYLKSISPNYKNLDVIEIGSGDSGKNFSAMHIFENSKTFLQTDINKNYGHKYLDITEDLDIEDKFDLVYAQMFLNMYMKQKRRLRI